MSDTKQQITDILNELLNPLVDIRTRLYVPDRKIAEVVEAIDRLVTEACLQEFKTMWNKTQPDIVPEGWTPDTEEGEYIKDRIAELKSQLNEEQK